MPHKPHTEEATKEPEAKTPRQFISFSFYKLDPAWRHLPDAERQKGREEWLEVVRRYQESGMVIKSFSLIGIRADQDILLWRIDYQLEQLQQMAAELSATGLGKYLLPSLSYLSMSKRSTYVDKVNPAHDDKRSLVQPGQRKYLFVYPFVKTREWYLLHAQTRQGLMDEHITEGMKFPTVKLNTTYSFGIDDQDFVVAFETNHPEDFIDLLMAMRETDASRYTARDTPFHTCIKGTFEEVLDTLGK
ncbi:MAG: chlorite dismutase family protein [Abditibacteriaceae bacterium]